MNERRLAVRHAHEVDVELHSRKERSRLRAVDVSRHGLFVTMDKPAPLHHALLLTVMLRGGPFECMATVVRRVTDQNEGALGMGLKLFCLGAAAKDRWDRFVMSLEQPGLLLPVREARSDGACFLVQHDTIAALHEFFAQNVIGAKTLYLSPAIRLIGAPVQVVLVHPLTQVEHTLEARVVEWNADHPLRMGIRFEHVDRRAFQRFLGAPPATPNSPLVAAARPRWTEYAYYSPKVRRDQSTAELDVVEGKLLEHPELELVDKKELFDFAWTNPEDDDEGT